MSIFDSLGQQTPMTPQQALADLKANPGAALKRAGFTVPDGISDPGQIIQYLLSSGQITQGRVNQLLASGFRR